MTALAKLIAATAALIAALALAWAAWHGVTINIDKLGELKVYVDPYSSLQITHE